MANYIKDIRSIVGHIPIRSVSAAVIVEYDNQILLQHRSDTLDYGTPGGNIELDEKILEGVKRELFEETGLLLDDLTLFGIYSGKDQIGVYPNGDVTHYVVIVFYKKIHEKPVLIHDDESFGLDFYHRDHLPTPIKPTDYAWIKDWVKQDFSIKID